MDCSHYGQAEFGFIIVDGVPTGYHPPGLGYLFGCAAQDLADDSRRQLGREGGNTQSQEHLPPHGIHIAHGIDRSDSAIDIGIVDHRGEKVGGKDECLVVVNPIDGSVIGRAEAYQEIGKTLLVKCLA